MQNLCKFLNEKTKHILSIISQVSKNRRIRTKNAHMPPPNLLIWLPTDIDLPCIFFPIVMVKKTSGK